MSVRRYQFYAVKNKETLEYAPSIRWSDGRVEAYHVFLTRASAREQASRLNVSGKRLWKVIPIRVIDDSRP